MRNSILIATVVILTSACAIPINQKKECIGLDVNGELWCSVSDFKNSTADDKHYVVKIDDDGAVVIIFGDGKHGARPPAGTNNIKMAFSVDRHYSGVMRQQGRVQIDDDWNENNTRSDRLSEDCQ